MGSDALSPCGRRKWYLRGAPPAPMRVVDGGANSPDADGRVTSALVAKTRRTGEPALRVWYPPRQAVFGPRDRLAAGYDRARALAAEQGFEPVDREVGGRAVVHTGSTLAFVLAEPADAARVDIAARYERVLDRLTAGLASVGVDSGRGEPPATFCPGSHSLMADGKLAGLAQRVRRDVAVTGGLIVVADATSFAAALAPLYRALDVPFEPASVGSVAAAGGSDDRGAVRSAVETALVGDAPRARQDARGTYDRAAR